MSEAMMETLAMGNEDFQDEVNEETIIVPIDTNESRIIDGNRICTKQRLCISFILISLLSATISGGIFLTNKSTSAAPSKTANDFNFEFNFDSKTSVPSASKNVNVAPLPEDTRRGMILSILRPFFFSNGESFPSSPFQIEAIDWISDVDTWTASSSAENDALSNMWLERYITAILYFAADGKSWEDANLWLTAHNKCDWKGIQCDRNSQVETIDLFNGSLSGKIPSELGMLTKMTSLILKKNQMSGTIPSELGILSQIETIDISYNNFTGMIPSEIGRLIRLDSLELSHNSLSGPIPLEVQNLARAGTHVYLGRNDVQDCDPSILICP